MHSGYVSFCSFQPYGAPVHLHSFPTRRSSDLAPQRVRGGRGAPTLGVAVRLDRGTHTLAIAGDSPAGGITDRKSTRLNSSHRCISYAVFCLKKKTIYRYACEI